jgi:hypothetical protein
VRDDKVNKITKGTSTTKNGVETRFACDKEGDVAKGEISKNTALKLR